MSHQKSKIIYTKTDEAPMLATHSLLPIIRAFTSKAGIEIETKDISLSARVLSIFPEYLEENKRVNDDLSELGELVKRTEANIIKLPNISASVPQLIATIEELQNKGFAIPPYPDSPKIDEEKEVQSKYNKVKGSAVNPVLREGNSDRRAPKVVKNYAKINPHSMGDWSANSRTHVATMESGDFFHNEKSVCIEKYTDVKIQLFAADGTITTLKESTPLLDKEIIDSSVMSKTDLISFLQREMQDAKNQGILLSLHMKATMMKVSDPIIFGHAVSVFFADLIEKHQLILNDLGVDFRNGFGDLVDKLQNLPSEKRVEIERDINDTFENNANLAMVDSDKGITNLHVPSDVIIDASMPAMIRTSGKMWNRDNKTEDTKAIIPDSSYASIYSATIDFCKQNGAFDPTNMGTVPNVGLMAQKAEEYGSHDKTFEIQTAGVVRVMDTTGDILIEHNVEEGDIWRMCQTKDDPIKNWVKLAVNRAKATDWPTVFWLDENRAHDAEIINKVNRYLQDHDTSGLNIKILPPYQATLFTLDRVKKGENTISVTGNVLRDYLTDLFPILELGTSAKMLSIVPLMNGGGLFETGAGGSAPKHVQQFTSEGHLRWDSLGEFLALKESLEHLSEVNNNQKAKVLAITLEKATEVLLMNGKSPLRKVGQLDNRGSHFYLAMYWARELSNQTEDKSLQSIFENVSDTMETHEEKIVAEINESQGNNEDINGYYFPDEELVNNVMRPSATLNTIIDNLQYDS
ncbi:MAG: NADP-dependent isocitrate dehydrogenase [Flavobacteriales bacterium]|nr:NADP-dependent isocitrate dehydrogenase [Flavobacteriales bacterium]